MQQNWASVQMCATGRHMSNPNFSPIHIPIEKGTMGGMPGATVRASVKGGSVMKGFGFFNQDGFETVIWIIVIIFLLSIFFDEGID
ncbi:hypothetical protein BAG01nite_25860 [Brevibacillus agri]|uniref:Uncharacterized protein n=1 Tax=Brevibacillus agri TaxID=51101 RepID=A0A3M8B415_9BACL|nr:MULTISPECIES: hypothetical protein [Brevibacillus]ELK43259.1 hypothetical protein D478_04386 [Brevibacillus agri BAB-2500]EJL43267.1 hypothetical protein PMI08_02812 [Brevibacillus sp. CF112]MBG9565948.1 hypothetical protein [Brevibacillus agri]MBY0054476.1 hypothetical protein [Brevibacillus agri]MCG5250930.1 hypothetical protein [Brevibacillus agri]